MHRARRARRLALFSFVLALGCSSKEDDAQSWPAPRVDLRADVNRNGTVDLDDPTEDQAEDSWDAKHGAVFLANIDDDLHACPITDEAGKGLSDYELPKCNDAANDVVDGDDDLLDLARMKTVPWVEVPKTAVGSIAVSTPMVRLFKKGSDGSFVVFDPAAETLTADEIAAGVELAIEGKDVVRDRAAWDGFVDVTFRVTFAGEGSRPAFDEKDVVRLRVAPVLLQHHGTAATSVFATKVGDDGAFKKDLGAAVADVKLDGGLQLLSVPEQDPWTQDFFETGFMSMPAPGGEQHVMRVVVRSSNIYQPKNTKNPLRPAGRVVFTTFRGKDVAGLQDFDPKANQDMDSLNSFGNTETIPPHEHAGKSWPLGRIIRGSIPSFHPDGVLEKILESQGYQDPVLIDTSWLLVGHVDETISFLPKSGPGPRSFALLANDARAAKKLLEDAKAAGHGGEKMFIGKAWLDYDTGAEIPAEKTIDEVLADVDVLNASAKAATEVDAQLEIIKSETGLGDDEIVKIPFLHMEEGGGSIAYQPGMVNGIWIDPTHFASPDPHGPVIDGKDIMKDVVEKNLAPYGVKVSWVEDWDTYHRNAGEVHCGSNVFRAIPSAKWWEASR